MGLLRDLKEFREFKEIKAQRAKDIRKPATSNTTTNLKSLVIKAIGELTLSGYNRETLIYPEYNMEEIREASESDSYVKMSLMKISYLIYKAGWQLKGKDAAVEYLYKRFRIMAYATGKPMDILFQEIADDMTKYSNAFLLKVRTDSIPGIKAKSISDNKKIIAGYYRIDPSSIVIERDKSGNIKRYIQGRGENERYFKKEDIVHIYMDKDANNAFGTPRIIAALDDVQLLRKIEGNVASLIYRFSRPIFHWKIGETKPGFQATDSEIKKAEREAENMSYESMIITNEKTELKAIGAEGTALDATGYLAYFEKRTFTALGTSETQMGRGSSKENADSMDEQTHDVVKYIQRTIATHIEYHILIELLLEGGFDPIMNEEDMVQYEFEEISLEKKKKKENHEMLKFQSNQITFEESRRRMGMKDSVDDEERLYKNMIEKKARLEELEITNQHQKDMQKETIKAQKEASNNNTSNSGNNATKTGTGGGSNKPKSTKKDTTTKEVENKNRPTNQHGTGSVKVKESFNNMQGCTKDNFKKEFAKIYKKYKDMSNDINEGEDMDLLFRISKSDLVNELNKHIEKYSYDAVIDSANDISIIDDKKHLIPKKTPNIIDFYEESDIKVQELLESIQEKIISGLDSQASFEVLEYRLRFLIDFLIRKVYWYSYIKTGQELGKTKAYILFNSEEDKKNHKRVLDINNFSYEQIPAYHSFCDCKITFDKAKYKKFYELD